ncbi:class A beta-lactamase [Aristophania vespae]|uniref:beta-lactamase n=1 Tax=Aristophania vespae TaxID=2697033 RepID=A0A6P1NCU7_9PROT|nr:class A beta-lactamase [Aristophania vespae]QHI96146.1 class A beta-lactamase [Aristophania vespae]
MSLDSRIVQVSRRSFMAGISLFPVFRRAMAHSLEPDFAAIERRSGGKIGVSVLDTETGKTLQWRANDRFPFCSSAKVPLVAYVLWKADRGEISLDQIVHYTEADLLPYAPVTRVAVSKGFLSIAELCQAAVTLSDNTAANLLWRETGGYKALNAWMQSEGDHEFNLSGIEPELNWAQYGDRHNTTTPVAMAKTYERFVLGDTLKSASRDKLTNWLLSNKTGERRIRAGLPHAWRVGDKTGTFNENYFSTVDIGVVWPIARRPMVIACFVAGTPDTDSAEYAIAEAAQAIASWMS